MYQYKSDKAPQGGGFPVGKMVKVSHRFARELLPALAILPPLIIFYIENVKKNSQEKLARKTRKKNSQKVH
jgi:hypothetical protein